MKQVQTNPQSPYLRFADLKRDYTLPKSTAYNLIKHHGFPAPIALSKQTRVFKRAEVEAWFAEREAISEGVA